MKGEDTICAIATAAGEGGIAIVRVSGAKSRAILGEIFVPKRVGAIRPYRLRYGHVFSKDGQVIDEAMCVYFRAPASYTAEDVVEVQCHGGQVQAERILRRVIEAGARIAEPGEFTRRAFENGRINLAEAEAVLALIRAQGELAARAATRQLSGTVASLIAEVKSALTGALSLIEATIDFPDEVEDAGAREEVRAAVNKSAHALDRAIDENGARAVREGASVVLVGDTNVGKSSLMNAILRRERAIVSEIPGTTRDVLTETIRLGGLLIELSDTAGRREARDPIEKIGIERAKLAQREADLVFLVIDAARGITDAEREALGAMDDDRVQIVVNKTDKATLEIDGAIYVSAKNGIGIDELMDVMRKRLSPLSLAVPPLTSIRQIVCAKEALAALESARAALDELPLDIAAEDIWLALHHLAALLGEDAREDVIDKIFSDFCVGK